MPASIGDDPGTVWRCCDKFPLAVLPVSLVRLATERCIIGNVRDHLHRMREGQRFQYRVLVLYGGQIELTGTGRTAIDEYRYFYFLRIPVRIRGCIKRAAGVRDQHDSAIVAQLSQSFLQ